MIDEKDFPLVHEGNAMTFTLLNFLLLPICRIVYPICQNKLMFHTPPKILFWEFLIWSTGFLNLEYIIKKVQSDSQNTSVNSKKTSWVEVLNREVAMIFFTFVPVQCSHFENQRQFILDGHFQNAVWFLKWESTF